MSPRPVTDTVQYDVMPANAAGPLQALFATSPSAAAYNSEHHGWMSLGRNYTCAVQRGWDASRRGSRH